MNNEVILEGKCYALLKTNKIHPIAFQRHDLLWYPETSMSLLTRVQYRPYVQSVVTECEWLIACYDNEDVFVWDNKHGWINPRIQTYGADNSSIRSNIFGIKQCIPSTPLDGGQAMQKLVKKVEDDYARCERY